MNKDAQNCVKTETRVTIIKLSKEGVHNTVDDAEWTCVYHLNHNALQPTVALVGHDCIQPASEEMWLPKLEETAVCPKEDLLRDVLCIGLVPHFLKGVGVDHVLIFVHQHSESVAVSRECSGH